MFSQNNVNLEESKVDFTISENHYGGGPPAGYKPTDPRGTGAKPMQSISSEQFQHNQKSFFQRYIFDFTNYSYMF